ncbi:MAG: hypothetical protein ACYC7D_02380 [Nitrososphaerales archaeon]
MQGGKDFPGSRPPIRERRNVLPYVILAVVLAIIGYVAANVWLNWTVLEYMYSNKAGLDWFSINFYGGLTFIIAGLLALLFINPIPRRSDLFEGFNAVMGLQYRQTTAFAGYGQKRIRPVYIRPGRILWAFWQFLKWVFLFGIFTLSNGFPGLGNITIVADMALKGFGSSSNVERIMVLPLYPASGAEIINLIPTMEIQYRLITYVITVLMIIVGLRFFLKFMRDVVIRAGDKWIRDIFIVLASVVFSVFVGIPYWGMDVTIPYEWGAVATVLLAFIVLAVFYQIKSTRETIPLAQRRRAGVVAATIIIAALLLFNIGAFTYYRINFNNNYIAYQWNPLVQKQVTVSRWAAGIQNINYTDITHIPSGNATKTLSLIRQWDATSSQKQSQNNIGVNWLQLVTPPEIVYLFGHEYWVSPTTFQYPDATDWVSTHLIYTHSSKIIVMDTHTGQFVDAATVFGLKSQPLMYYGEDVNSTGYGNDVYVNVNGYQEVENVSYSASPDYTLCGAQRTIWFLSQLQPGFAFSPPQDCIQVLHDREVFQRVQNVLISGLSEDSSAYLVTDSANGGNSLYFAIQIYIDYPLQTGFSATPNVPVNPNTPIPYLRFFGVVLVNVANGQMHGYSVANNDGFLASFYKQYYPSWTTPPAWLQAQLRYPEQLLGNQQSFGQLDTDFFFHVNDAFTFRSGSDFFERPSATSVLYIPFVIGNNVSFAAVQLVEFQQSSGKNLAGLYVVYGGDQLGQFYLYQANATGGGNSIPLLGPTAAANAFATDQATKQQITLTGATQGNILLYPINGHLYYFIPAYIYQQSGTSVVARNPFIDVIDALNASTPVRLIQTSSSTASNYGFNVFLGTNSTLRTNYAFGLFASQGVSLQNATITNSNIVDNLGTVTYTQDSQNLTASLFINNFINSYFKNAMITGGSPAFNTVYYWEPSAGTIDFGFLVSAQGVSKLYTFTLIVGQ